MQPMATALCIGGLPVGKDGLQQLGRADAARLGQRQHFGLECRLDLEVELLIPTGAPVAPAVTRRGVPLKGRPLAGRLLLFRRRYLVPEGEPRRGVVVVALYRVHVATPLPWLPAFAGQPTEPRFPPWPRGP